jgi:hypothetical protein
MPISRRSTIILVLAAFLIALIPKHTIAGNKASRIGKLHHKVAHHRGDRIGKLDCAFGEIAKFDGSEWICAPDDNSDTVGELNCASGEIAKFDGSEWICAPDDNSDTVGELSCSDGQVTKYDENSNEWACADVGDGPQPCPAGFVALNDKVCIEELDKGTSFTWFDANRSCVIDSNARLCTPGEWVAACQEEDIIISNSASRFEWTDDVADPGGFITVLQFVNCTHLAITRADSANATFRCCQDR